MYVVTHKNIISAINDYNIGKSEDLEHILTNLHLDTFANYNTSYIDTLYDLAYETVDNVPNTVYYQFVALDYVRIWYDAYLNHNDVLLTDSIPIEYIINDNNAHSDDHGFKFVDSNETFVDRTNSKILDSVNVSLLANVQLSTVTNLALDYINDPSTDNADQIRESSHYNLLPKNFLYIYALALRTFQDRDIYIHLVPYLYNMLLTTMYTNAYISGENLDMIKNYRITKDYVDHLGIPKFSILTQIDQLSEYVSTMPELDSVQSHCMDLFNSIAVMREDTLYNPNVLGLWKGISSGNKIGSESVFGNVFTVDILNKIKMLVKTAQESGDIVSDTMTQYHETYIGLRMNELRATIPNFMYCYGLDHITPPYARITSIVDDRSNEVVLWDDSKAGITVPNVFLEYIGDSKSFTEVIDSFLNGQDAYANTVRMLTPNESGISLLTQLALALNMAYVHNGFMHNDLHTNNMLVRTLDEAVWLEYRYKDELIYVYTRHIIMIIDYGMSSILNNNIYIRSPSIIYDYTTGNDLSDILKAYMNTLSRYALDPNEYSVLFNVFSQAFGTNDQSIELTQTETILFTRMSPNYGFIPPGDASGLQLHSENFYDALIDYYIKLQPQVPIHIFSGRDPEGRPIQRRLNKVLDLNKKIRLQYQSIFNIDSLQSLILWDRIIELDILTNIEERMSNNVKAQVVNDMSKLYNNVLMDCTRETSMYTFNDMSSRIIRCLNDIPSDILSRDKISMYELAYIADVVSAYIYTNVLCLDNTIPESLCVHNQLLRDTLTRIDLSEFIQKYMKTYYYLNSSNSAINNSIFNTRKIIIGQFSEDAIELFKTDASKSFVLNVFNPNILLA